MSIKIEYVGHIGYEPMLNRQRDLFSKRVELKKNGSDSGEDIIFIVEHDPVITLGRHAHKENILIDKKTLADRGVDLFEIERGGDVTYHGPGQLVAYPVIDLEHFGLGVRDYVDILEESVIRLLRDYGIRGERMHGASGVWIDPESPKPRKICALGVKISRYITMHGLALNVNTDLDGFTMINPCGFIDRGVTSMSRELQRTLPMEDVGEQLSAHLCDILQRRVIPLPIQ